MKEKHALTPLESAYRKLADERGPKTPRGWDPTQLAGDFVESVTQLQEVLIGTGPFHDGGRKLLPAPAGIRKRNRIANTDELASLLETRPRFRVDRHRKLDFHYLDREITVARALDVQGRPRYQASPVQLDLLLVNAEDETPIAGEIKVRADKDPEAALLQGLLYASLLAPEAQRTRLAVAYPDVFRGGIPKRVDVYVILHALPKSRRKLLDSALALAPPILSAPGVSHYLRRICFLEAYLKSDALRFRLEVSAELEDQTKLG
jgi:hypothetical protein